MDLRTIRRNLIQAVELVEGWSTQTEVSGLERDLVLDKIRTAYDAIRFSALRRESIASPVVPVEPIPVSAPVVPTSAPAPSVEGKSNEVDEEESAEPEIEVELIMADGEDADDETDDDLSDGEYDDVEPSHEEDEEDEEGEEGEGVEVDEPNEEPQRTSEPIEQSKKEVSSATSGGSGFEQLLFGGDAPTKRVRRRSVMMSLYDDEPQMSVAESSKSAPQPAPQPAPKRESITPMPYVITPTPMEEIDAEAVLGEVLMPEVHTLGDSLGCATSVADTAPVATLRSSIAVADKFMIMRELFNGDEQAFNRAVDALDAYDNFDDCMIHIVENYAWRTTSEGARLVIDLLQRKFQQK